MTEAYYKARRLFAFFSGILIAWEYVGIEIPKKTNNMANIKIPGIDSDISLRNPEIIPVIILILIIYFGIRFTIEWYQCTKEKRKSLVSRIDVTYAYIIGVVAIVLYGIQKISGFRFADIITPVSIVGFLLGCILSFVITLITIYVTIKTVKEKRVSDKNFRYLLIINLLLPSLLIFVVWRAVFSDRLELLISTLLGPVFVDCFTYFYRMTSGRREAKKIAKKLLDAMFKRRES